MFWKTKCNHWAKGYASGKPYLVNKYTEVDGIGRIHLSLYARCNKCGEEFPYAMLHLDRVLRELCSHPNTRSDIQEIIDNTPIKK